MEKEVARYALFPDRGAEARFTAVQKA